MSHKIFQFIVPILIPCLLLNSASANGIRPAHPIPAANIQLCFSQQAVMPRGPNFWNRFNVSANVQEVRFLKSRHGLTKFSAPNMRRAKNSWRTVLNRPTMEQLKYHATAIVLPTAIALVLTAPFGLRWQIALSAAVGLLGNAVVLSHFAHSAHPHYSLEERKALYRPIWKFGMWTLAGMLVAYTTMHSTAWFGPPLALAAGAGIASGIFRHSFFNFNNPRPASSPENPTDDDYRRRRMAALSDGTGGWSALQDQWDIAALTFSPGGIQNAGWTDPQGRRVESDEFGNRPHWIYELQNRVNGNRVYVGQDDIRHLLPAREAEIQKMREEKETLITQYRLRAEQILALTRWLAADLDSGDLPALLQKRMLGDRDFPRIDQQYDYITKLWQKNVAEGSVENFYQAVQELQPLKAQLLRRRLNILSASESNRLIISLESLERGGSLTPDQLRFVAQIHRRLAAHQNYLARQAAGWALGRAQAVDPTQEARTPAYQANLWIATWLADRLRGTTRHPLILDVGANHSVFWRVFQQALDEHALGLADGVIDLEDRQEIFDNAPNPHGILADIASLPEIRAAKDDISRELVNMDHGFDMVIASFVLDQLNAKQLRAGLLAIDRKLANPPAGVSFSAETAMQFPLLILASPEHSPLLDSPLDHVLQRAGYAVVGHYARVINHLTAEAKERLLREEGPERLRAIESEIAKPFHIALYAKVRPLDEQSLKRLPARFWTIRGGQTRERTNPDETALLRPVRLDIDRLYGLDVLATLNARDFRPEALQGLVTRTQFLTRPDLESFERGLISLIWLSRFLTPQEREMVRFIRASWDRPRGAFVTQQQINFVLKRPKATNAQQTLSASQVTAAFPYLLQRFADERRRLREERLPEIYRQRLPDRQEQAAISRLDRELERRRYTLAQIVQFEEDYREGEDLDSLLEETRSPVAIRLHAIRTAVKASLAQGRSPNLRTISAKLGLSHSTLPNWARDNEIDLAVLGIRVEGVTSRSPGERSWVDRDKRLEDIAVAVALAKESGQPASLSFVSEQLGLSISSLTTWAERNDIDLESRGVISTAYKKVDRAQRMREIAAVVDALKAAGLPATLEAVSERLGLKDTGSLPLWADSRQVSLLALGVQGLPVKHPTKFVPRAKRIQDIQRAVDVLTKQGQPPNRRNVSKYLELEHIDSLTSWAERNAVDLSSLGILDDNVQRSLTVAAIRSAVKDLKREGKTRSLNAVASRLGKKSVQFKRWSKENAVDLHSLGIVEKERQLPDLTKRLEEIAAAVADLKRRQIKPILAAVARALNMHISSLVEWAKRYRIALADLGIERETVDKAERIQRIEEAVKKLRGLNVKPNLRRVAKELGLYGGSNLSEWADVHDVDLTVHGVVIKANARVDREKRIYEIITAVRELQEEGKKPIVGAVARKLGIKGSAFSSWARRNGVDLDALGVAHGDYPEVSKEARISEILTAVSKAAASGLSSSATSIAKLLGISSSALLDWANANGVDLSTLGVTPPRSRQGRNLTGTSA